MRGKRELPRKRPPILLFVLILPPASSSGTLSGTSTLLVRPFRQEERSPAEGHCERTSLGAGKLRPRRRMKNLG